VEDILGLVRQQVDRVRRRATEREAGFAEIIEVLTKAVDEIAGQAAAFNSNILGESEQIRRLLQLDDVGELKRRVTERVDALRQAVAERQQQDEVSRMKLSGRVTSLQTRLSEAEIAASIDPLTGVGNRRQFEAALARLAGEACDTGRCFALALLDVDDFKRINDEHGHQVGDRVLVALAQNIAHKLRKGDVVTRYGGEEFAILLSGTGLANAGKRLGQVVAEIAASDFAYEGSRRVKFTVSAGVAEFTRGESVEALTRRADEGLYAAKRAGKNRVVSVPHHASGAIEGATVRA
jgi:diguanylate cyclase (GGDEF)-like protein